MQEAPGSLFLYALLRALVVYIVDSGRAPYFESPVREMVRLHYHLQPQVGALRLPVSFLHNGVVHQMAEGWLQHFIITLKLTHTTNLRGKA
mgnify:CR=1 FL=1